VGVGRGTKNLPCFCKQAPCGKRLSRKEFFCFKDVTIFFQHFVFLISASYAAKHKLYQGEGI
jgi:hypothetical protein